MPLDAQGVEDQCALSGSGSVEQQSNNRVPGGMEAFSRVCAFGLEAYRGSCRCGMPLWSGVEVLPVAVVATELKKHPCGIVIPGVGVAAPGVFPAELALQNSSFFDGIYVCQGKLADLYVVGPKTNHVQAA